MEFLLQIVVFLPFAGFLVLGIAGKFLKRSWAGLAGTGSVGLSALFTIVLGINYLTGIPEPFTVHLWNWITVAGLHPDMALYLDPLSLVFLFVITFVGFLIHLYSLEYMRDEDGFARFFAYMNLFIGSMLVLVLADNFLLLYLGWEGVGLCSFLLIGFWYRTPENNRAAAKAFIVTRIGDAALAIGLFLLFFHFGTLDIHKITANIQEVWDPGSPVANAAALLILAGAVGKSAQLPLQTWLPDAMAGPTPVSALIHSATMVTAGVYLVARTHAIFLFSPAASLAVAIIGAATLLIAGLSALAQSDIKRVLAYSTISQVGYMFLGLGVGAWSAAVFHFMIHAFFKSLLFLGAGVVILAMDHEKDMFKMGGLRRKLPLTFLAFLAGSLSLSALPLITAGYYSKDQILFYALEGTRGDLWLWIAGMAGVFITALYTFRMVFLTFYGDPAGPKVRHLPGPATKTVLVILAILSMVAGFINLPHFIAHFAPFSDFLSANFTSPETAGETAPESFLALLSGVLTLAGIATAYLSFRIDAYRRMEEGQLWPGLHHFLRSGFGFDRIYRLIFVRPVAALARMNRNDFIDWIYAGLSAFFLRLNRGLVLTQPGRISWYLMGIVFGAILILTFILSL